MKVRILMLLFLLWVLCGCSTSHTVTGAQLAPGEHVTQIRISSLPEAEDLRRTYTEADKIKAVTDYIDSLILTTDFPENPNEYAGSTRVITYVYADGSKLTLYHFGNTFFRTENSPWTKLDPEQAGWLDRILQITPRIKKTLDNSFFSMFTKHIPA